MPKDDPGEIFVRVNRKDEVIGPVERGEAHSNAGIIHRAVTVLLTNDSGQVLMQKRSLAKDMDPGRWALSCGGHVSWGETYIQAARRELREELGIDGEKLVRVKKMLVEIDAEREVVAIFLMRINKMPEKIDKDEIDELAWEDWLEIKRGRTRFELTPFDIVVVASLPEDLRVE